MFSNKNKFVYFEHVNAKSVKHSEMKTPNATISLGSEGLHVLRLYHAPPQKKTTRGTKFYRTFEKTKNCPKQILHLTEHI